jgi:hypothetical protein
MKKMVEIPMHSLEDLMTWHAQQASRFENLAEEHRKKYEPLGRYGESVVRGDYRKATFHRMAETVCANAIVARGQGDVFANKRPLAGPGGCVGLAPHPAGAGADAVCIAPDGPEVCGLPETDPTHATHGSEEDRLSPTYLEDLAKRARATPGSFWPSTGT